MQVHTTEGSDDSQLDPRELVNGCVHAGLDGVGITEHSASVMTGTAEMLAAAGLVLVPGREVSCGIAHLLVFSTDQDLLMRLPRSISLVEPALSHPDVACVWAHPAAAGGSGAYPPFIPPGEQVSKLVHAVEVLNGRHLAFGASVTIAVELAASLGLNSTGGSDAHDVADVGRCFTEVDARPQDGASGVIRAIRGGATRPVLSEMWARSHGYDYREDLERFLG